MKRNAGLLLVKLAAKVAQLPQLLKLANIPAAGLAGPVEPGLTILMEVLAQVALPVGFEKLNISAFAAAPITTESPIAAAIAL
jgi:hypothetical protein